MEERQPQQHTHNTPADGCWDMVLCNMWKPVCRSLRRDLSQEDAPPLPKNLSAEYWAPRAERAWANEVMRHPDDPSFFRVLSQTACHYVIFGMVIHPPHTHLARPHTHSAPLLKYHTLPYT